MNTEKIKHIFRKIVSTFRYLFILIPFNFFKSPCSIILIVIIISAFFLLCFFNIHLPVIGYININEAHSLIEKNLTRFVSWSSAFVAIIIIIFSIIQIKKATKDILKNLFSESFIFPIFWFFTICVIFLMAISHLQYSNLPDIFFIRAAALSGYLFIFSIISMGVFFIRLWRILGSDFLFEKSLQDIIEFVKKEEKNRKESYRKKEWFKQRLEEMIFSNEKEKLNKIIKAVIKIQKIKPDSIFIFDIPFQISQFLKNATNEKNQEAIRNILFIWCEFIFYALENVDEKILSKFNHIPSVFYKQFYKNKYQSLEYAKNIAVKLKTFLMIVGQAVKEQKTIKEKRKYIPLSQNLLIGFSNLIKSAIDVKDYNGLKYISNSFRQIPDETYPFSSEMFNMFYFSKVKLSDNNQNEMQLSAEFYKLFLLQSIGLNCWIYFLYDNDKINEEALKQLITLLPFPRHSPIDTLHLLSNFTTKDEIPSASWDEWTWNIEEHLEGNCYTIPSALDWIRFGVVIYLLHFVNIKSSLIIESFSNKNYFSLYCQSLINDLEKIKNSSKKWLKIFSNIKQNDLLKRIENLKNLFESLKSEYDKYEKEQIALCKISQAKIKEFKNDILNDWQKSKNIERLFEYKNNIIIENNEGVRLKKVGRLIDIADGKQIFIEQFHHPIFGLSVGSLVSKSVDNYFFQFFKDEKENKVEYDIAKSFCSAVDIEIKKMVTNNYKPDVILISKINFYRNNDFIKTKKFKYEEQIAQKLGSNYIGTYNNVIMYNSYNDFLHHHVVILDFKKSLNMKIRENSKLNKASLFIDVLEVSIEKAIEIYDKDPLRWSVKDGKPLSKTDAQVLIKNIIQVDIFEVLDFDIKDKKAFEILYFREVLSEYV